MAKYIHPCIHTYIYTDTDRQADRQTDRHTVGHMRRSYKQYYVKTLWYFYLRLFLLFLFQMQEKLETGRNSNLIYFRRPSFSDDMNVTFVL